MNIPSQFDLMGRTFKVNASPKLGIDYHGLCSPDTNEIHISKDIPYTKMESVFFHELVHAILSLMGECELYGNEKFVETFGGLLHQAMSTSKGVIK